jgi:hypothetical protein
LLHPGAYAARFVGRIGFFARADYNVYHVFCE